MLGDQRRTRLLGTYRQVPLTKKMKRAALWSPLVAAVAVVCIGVETTWCSRNSMRVVISKKCSFVSSKKSFGVRGGRHKINLYVARQLLETTPDPLKEVTGWKCPPHTT